MQRTGIPRAASPCLARHPGIAAAGTSDPRRRHFRAGEGGRQRRYPVQARQRGLANLLHHGYGGLAEYAPVPADVMSLKPPNLSFEEAAAVPMAAATALPGPRYHTETQPGQKVLINGAFRRRRHLAVQIARSYHRRADRGRGTCAGQGPTPACRPGPPGNRHASPTARRLSRRDRQRAGYLSATGRWWRHAGRFERLPATGGCWSWWLSPQGSSPRGCRRRSEGPLSLDRRRRRTCPGSRLGR
jgi:hypothetical protein